MTGNEPVLGMACVENWQILSPYRNRDLIGTRSINAAIQAKYRLSKSSSRYMKRKTKHPMGIDGILYGEKVINVTNTTKDGYPSDGCQNYIANGEVGIVERLWEKPKDQRNSHQIRFSTQPDHCYNFSSTVSEDDSPLELAYALTVHKAQGSGFKASIFVLIEPDRGLSPLVTREMLYTALTRQTNKVFIIYNKQPSEIIKYGDAELSDLAHRKTYLFEDTVLRQVKNGWYDSKNIFITVDGTRVKSKSEVIVYDLLYLSGKLPIYEQVLHLSGIPVHPDFTLETPLGTVYWEHLGMLGDYSYSRAWERKRILYAQNGISEEKGNLILSRDELTGAIDAQIIHSILQNKLDLHK